MFRTSLESAPVYATTPRTHAVFLSVDPRRSKLSAHRGEVRIPARTHFFSGEAFSSSPKRGVVVGGSPSPSPSSPGMAIRVGVDGAFALVVGALAHRPSKAYRRLFGASHSSDAPSRSSRSPAHADAASVSGEPAREEADERETTEREREHERERERFATERELVTTSSSRSEPVFSSSLSSPPRTKARSGGGAAILTLRLVSPSRFAVSTYARPRSSLVRIITTSAGISSSPRSNTTSPTRRSLHVARATATSTRSRFSSFSSSSFFSEPFPDSASRVRASSRAKSSSADGTCSDGTRFVTIVSAGLLFTAASLLCLPASSKASLAALMPRTNTSGPRVVLQCVGERPGKKASSCRHPTTRKYTFAARWNCCQRFLKTKSYGV